MSKSCTGRSASLWTRRVAAGMAATAAISVAGVGPANASTIDSEAPVIVSAWVSHPQIIDVIDGPVRVTARVEVEDVGSGVGADYPQLRVHSNRYTIPAQTMTLVSGDRFHGTYETVFTFPEHVPNDVWEFQPRIVDLAGNRYQEENFLPFSPTTVSLEDNDAPDVTAATSIKFAATSGGARNVIDITDGPVPVAMTVNAYDAGIGFRPDASVSIGANLRQNSSTDVHRGVFTGTYEFARYNGDPDSLGPREIWSPSVADANGNTSPRYKIQDVIFGTRPLRAKLPALSASIGSVKASWAAHSDVLGILEYETEFTGTGIVRNVRTTVTQASLNDLPAGTFTARVRARNQLGWGDWTNASAPVAYIPAPLSGSTPTISGTVKVGQTLTANPGAWTTGTTFAYQWLAGGLAVSGATGSTLVLGQGQAGKAIAVRVTGSKTGYVTASKTSAATSAVAKGSLVGVAPTITGTVRVGSTLTADPGSWSPAPVTLSYQWYGSGVVITGATLSTYALTTADLGKTITVRAAASKSGYNYTYKTSAATASVATNVLTAPRPVIPASAAVGQTLTVKVGVWTPTVYLRTYQWKRNGISIPGATASSYKVVAADLGAGLSIAVTGRKSGYLTETVTSSSTAPVTK